MTDLWPGGPSAPGTDPKLMRQLLGPMASSLISEPDNQIAAQSGRSYPGIVSPYGNAPIEPDRLDYRPTGQPLAGLGMTGDDAFRVGVKKGFNDGLLGSLNNWIQRDGFGQADPDYDIFSDPDIRNSPWKDQMHLFMGASNKADAQWRLARLQQRAYATRQMAQMPEFASMAGDMVGGILSDPTNLMPLTFAVKSAAIFGRLAASAATAGDLGLIATRPAILGAIRDGLISSSAQMGVLMAGQLAKAGVDPTQEMDDLAVTVVIPGLVAGSTSVVVSGSRRFVAARRAMFPAGPAAKPRPPTFDATNMAEADIVRRTEMWASEAEFAKTMPDWMKGQPGAPGYVKPISTPPTPSVGNELMKPGALATNHPALRAAENVAEESPVGKVFKPGELPEVDIAGDRRGRPHIVYNGETVYPAAHAPGTEFGIGSDIWRVNARQDGFDFVLTDARKALDEAANAASVARGGPGFLDAPVAPKAAAAAGPTLVYEGKTLAAVDYPEGTVFVSKDGTAMYVHGQDAAKTFQPVVMQGGTAGDAGSSLSARQLAALTPEQRRLHEIGQNRLASTGPLPKWGLNAIFRSAASNILAFQDTIENLVGAGGLLRVKNMSGVASAVPVEDVVKQRWNPPLVDALRGMQDDWHALRTGAAAAASASRGDTATIAFNVSTYAKDWWRNSKDLSFEAFRRRVGDALRNGDKDAITDASTPFVEKAAARNRKVYDELAAEGMDVKLFEADKVRAINQQEAALKKLNKALEQSEKRLIKATQDEKDILARTHTKEELAGARARKLTEEKMQPGLQEEILKQELKQEKLIKSYDELVANGLEVKTAKSYLNRMWLVDKLLENENKFKQIAGAWFRKQHGLSLVDAQTNADAIFRTLTKQNPLYTQSNIDALFNDVAKASGTQARTFDIPDELVKEFLENDAEVLLRNHTKDMGSKIEMHRRFGSTGLEGQVKEVQDEVGKLLGESKAQRQAEMSVAARPEDKARIKAKYDAADAAMKKEMEGAIEDIQAMRDRIYGTYGAANDPHTWDNRLIRVAKQFTNMTVLGLAGVSSTIDLVRPLMTEGLQATYEAGFLSLASNMRGTILKMALDDLRFSGDGAELILNLRAASLSDMGDITMHRTSFERGMHKANSWYFVLNGLNHITQASKQWASLIIQGKMNQPLIDFAMNGTKLPDWQRARLAGVGIGDVEMARIGEQLHTHGVQFKSIRLANTGAWHDVEAARAYAMALGSMTNRTVPTPGLGDAPNFMSGPVASMLTQYKSFAIGQLIRTLYSGVQEGSAQFWYGAAGMVGAGIVLNELRSRAFFDKSTFDRPLTAVIADGVDRASLLGFFGDANRAIETLSGNRVGLRPLIGAGKAGPVNTERAIGTFAGPAVSQGINGALLLKDIASGHPTARDWARARQLIPGQNLPWLDKAMDHTISDGSWYKKLTPEEKEAQKERKARYRRYQSAQAERDAQAKGTQ